MEKNKSNLPEHIKNNDIFSTPEIEIREGFSNTLKKWTKKNKKVIIPVAIIILLLVIIFIFISSNKSKLFPPVINANYVKNYQSGLESNIEFILLNLHNDIPVPDSIEYRSDSIQFIRKDITEMLSRDKLHRRLSDMGFVYSIVIDFKSYKDLYVESWIYRANYNDNEKNLVYAEFVIDFENKDNVITIRSLELNYEHFKSIELPVITTPSDTTKQSVKKDSLISSDSTAKVKKDTSSAVKSKEEIIEDGEKKSEEAEREKINGDDTKKEETPEIKSEDKDKPASRDTSKK
ncbi:MAG: hypothetical protein JW917_06345 [Ignavibacteria bacterium]|nr:hypothetical protein [Ignavibacteria bacterium]